MSKINRRQTLTRVGLAAAAGLCPPLRGVRAETPYPTRAVTIVVPLAPGGSTDLLARSLAQFLGAEFAQTFVIDNRPGGGGTVGHAYVARARPDGYTMLMSTNSTYAIAPHLYSLSYDYNSAFTPVTRLAKAAQAMCVHRSVPATNVGELIAWARRNPGRLAFSSAGIGVTSHLAAELFMSMAGIAMLHVPYRGGGPAIQALMAGEVQVNFADAVSALAVGAQGTARPMAVTTKQRSPLFPDLPTLDEAGLAGYESFTDFALVLPAGTPAEVVTNLLDGVRRFVSAPAEREALIERGYEPVVGTPAEFTASRLEETAKWGAIIRDRRIVASP